MADAVGLVYGASHIEIMLTPQGPVLVEIAARISGATNVPISNEVLGYNVIDATIDSYLGHLNLPPQQVLKTEMIIDLATHLKGVIKAIPLRETLKNLQSVKSVLFKVKEGGPIQPTVSLPTSPVKIHMVHADRSQLLRDKDLIKQAAQAGFVLK